MITGFACKLSTGWVDLNKSNRETGGGFIIGGGGWDELKPIGSADGGRTMDVGAIRSSWSWVGIDVVKGGASRMR